MHTLTIRLTKALQAHVDEAVAEGGFRSPSAYLSHLVQERWKQKEKARIEGLLLEGVRSGFSPMTKQDWKDIEREALAEIQARKRNGRKSTQKRRRAS